MRAADEWGVRRFLAIVLCTGLALANTGCWVLGELDKSNADMDKLAGRREGAQQAPEAAPASGPGASATAAAGEWAEKARTWWAGARTLTPGEGSEGIVRCRIGSEEIYTQATECAARRGQPLASN